MKQKTRVKLGSMRVSCTAMDGVKQCLGGSCEIRTHGTFLFGSFQDCWFKPLTQTSLFDFHWQSERAALAATLRKCLIYTATLR